MTADDVLHFATRALLRTLPPLKARAVVMHLGSVLPQLTSAAEVRRAAERLRVGGSCLSRSLAIAARSPSSAVVIGVEPRPGGVDAHAWLEVDGENMDTSGRSWTEIARLAGDRVRQRQPG